VKKLLTIALLSGLSLLGNAAPAAACSCGGMLTFEQSARDAPFVVVGRVASFGELKYDDDPASIDVEVEWVAKGAITSSQIRVWNTFAGSSCGGVFGTVKAGTYVVMALDAVKAPTPEEREYLDLVEIHPPLGDYVIRTACEEGLRALKDKRERNRWIGRTIR
jgi:hypothetical protein